MIGNFWLPSTILIIRRHDASVLIANVENLQLCNYVIRIWARIQ